MRHVVVLGMALVLVLPSVAAAEAILRPHDPQAAERPLESKAGPPGILGEKVDEPADVLIVPFYEIDTLDPFGTTTLFAVRNISSQTIDLDIRYFSPTATIRHQDLMSLGPRKTYTRNIRDVPGLPADDDHFARGYVAVRASTAEPTLPKLVGDYLQVDVANNFATGERMVSFSDFCYGQEIRFLDFGSGTELHFLLGNPRGPDVMTDPPSFTVTPYDEDGNALAQIDVFTGDFMLEFPADAFTPFTNTKFGTLVIDFSNSDGGVVYAEYSAGGKFSVGINGACTVVP